MKRENKNTAEYLEKRRRNNLSAKKSRDKKKAEQEEIRKQLEGAREQLRQEMAAVDYQFVRLAHTDPQRFPWFYQYYETMRRMHCPETPALPPIQCYAHIVRQSPTTRNNVVITDEELRLYRNQYTSNLM